MWTVGRDASASATGGPSAGEPLAGARHGGGLPRFALASRLKHRLRHLLYE